MKISKRVLSPLKGVYSVASVARGGRKCLLAASELPGGSCLLIDPLTGGVDRVWSAPGGTMSIVPTSETHFFAVQQFYAGFNAAASIIVEATRQGPKDSWMVSEKMKLPYLHRLASVPGAGTPTLLASTLCSGKTNVDDWSSPGAVYRISQDSAWTLVPIMENLHRNHGLVLTTLSGASVALVGCMEGLFSINLSGGGRPVWTVERLVGTDVSDAVTLDWDGDGREELLTIEPFHGNRFVFYKLINGAWQRIHEMPCELGHSLWSGDALGRKALILGERMGQGRIQLVFPTASRPGDWERVTVDEETGGTNVTILNATDHLLEFVSANNDRNEIGHYRVER